MASFRKLSDNLAELAIVPSRISRTVSDRINDLITEQFSQGKDPYEKPWKPLKATTIRRKGGDNRILLDSNLMSEETVARPMAGSGVRISTTSYAGFHQVGTSRMVAREVLPDRSDLPLKWQKAIETAVSGEVAQVMRK